MDGNKRINGRRLNMNNVQRKIGILSLHYFDSGTEDLSGIVNFFSWKYFVI